MLLYGYIVLCLYDFILCFGDGVWVSCDGVVSVILFESAFCCMSPDLCYVSVLHLCIMV